MAYANTAIATSDSSADNLIPDQFSRGFGGRGFCGGHGRGFGGGFGNITVTQEFKDNVLGIMQNDSDVQNLLTGGYNITSIRPMISSTVEGDGTVITKATSAVVTLNKDTRGKATVLVDLAQGKVTRIVILTRTVIDKS